METSQLQSEAILSLKDYLQKLGSGVNNCINFFREDNEIEGLKYVSYIVEGLNWSIETILLTNKSNLHNIEIDGIDVLLQDMINAMENKDYVLLADLLEYEVAPLIQDWQNGLREKQLN